MITYSYFTFHLLLSIFIFSRRTDSLEVTISNLPFQHSHSPRSLTCFVWTEWPILCLETSMILQWISQVIIKFSGNTINAYSFLSHKCESPIIKLMVRLTNHLRKSSIYCTPRVFYNLLNQYDTWNVQRVTSHSISNVKGIYMKGSSCLLSSSFSYLSFIFLSYIILTTPSQFSFSFQIFSTVSS